MGLAGKSATFMRKARRSIHLHLPFVLVVSTLSLISVSTASATARTVGSGACSQTYTFNSGADAVSVIEDGGFCYIAFRNTAAAGSVSSSYSWTKPAGVTSLNVLVVGGGGGGGARHGGGGGAGSYVEAIGLAAPSIATSINVIVGAGGIGAAGGSSPFVGAGAKGSPSSFRIGTTNGLFALGGGAGINGSDQNIVDGGSGGGAGASQVAGEAFTSTQRELQSATTITGIEFVSVGAPGANDPNSGTSNGRDYWAAGGGGGAGGSGKRPTFNNVEFSSFSDGTGAGTRGGNGGVGKIPSSNLLNSTIASQLSVGHVVSGQVYFAGGGGGGMGADGEAGGSGGLGGGGNGTKAVSTGGVPGLVSTGGGGGGSGFDDESPVVGDVANPPGGAGGSGVVLIRYTATYTVTYNYNNATGGNSTSSSTFTTGGTTITLPSPTRIGYTFGGWFVASDFSGSALGSTYSPTSSLTINAKWNAKTCTRTEVISGGFTRITFSEVQDCAWTVPNGVTRAEVLVVGGGGGGGGAHDGSTSGGGAAGYVYENSDEAISGTLTVAVGSGGLGGVGVTQDPTPEIGATGGDSRFGSVVALGGTGGFGGYDSYLKNSNSCPTSSTPVRGGSAATLLQRATGGQDGCNNLNGFGGGGQSATQSQSGGAGRENSITGTAVTYGTGGTGGTDNGNVSPAAQSPNSGNGGTGAASPFSSGRTGGAGGSGVVIIRYANVVSFSYDLNGATSGSIPASGSAQGGVAFTTAASTGIARTNYNFGGWCTTQPALGASCSGTLLTAGVSQTMPVSSTSLTFYAVWTGVSQTITYASGGGTGSAPSSPTSVAFGGTFTTPANTYTRNGFFFAGWNDGTNTYLAGATYPATGTVSGNVTLTAQWTSCGSAVVSTGLLLHLDAGNSCSTTGSTTDWRDISLNGNHATLFSNPTYSSSNGGNYSFATSGQHGTLPTGFANFTSGFSISFYARFPSLPGAWERIIDFGNGDANNNIWVGRVGDTSQIGLEFWNGSNPLNSLGICASDSETIVGNTWAHFAMTVDATNGCRIYKNGSLIKTVSTYKTLPTNISRSINYIARSNWAADSYFMGEIGDLAVYNTSLTSAQVQTNLSAQASTLVVTYDSQNGTLIANGSTAVGGSISSSPGTPTRAGFTFNGWFASSTGGSAISFPYTHGQTANFTLFAQWSPNYSVNVTQTSNGTILFNGSTASETITVTSGADRTFTFAPSAGYEVESIIIDGVSISTTTSPNLTNLQTAITSGYTFTNITSNRTISATYSAISSSNLLLNLDATRSSSLSAAGGTTTPTWTSITPGATVSATGTTGTQVATGSTTTPNTPKSVYLNNNGTGATAGTGASFNFGSGTGASLGTTGQASPVTVEMWINPKTLRGTTNTPWNILFTKWFSTIARAGGAGSSEFHYSLKWDGTAVRQNLFTTSCSDKYGSRTFGTGADFALNTWQLIGFTVDASGNLQFYVNGKSDGSPHTGCGITIRNTPLAILGDVIQTLGFDGSVAKLRFYNTALSAATMQSNYNADARLFAKSPIYTITYNYDNATSGNSVQSADYTFGETTITLPTPSRTGYTFNGWFTQASGGSKIGDGGAAFTPNSSATIFAQWSFSAALNPAFGSPTATADGFTVSITNYDATYTWATPTVSSGSVAVTSTTGSTRVLTVTGLSPGASATITQNTTRAAHSNGTGTVTGTATTGAARVPTFNTPTRTSDGFTVTITNYDAAFTWDTATVTAGLVSVTSTSGSNRVLTVTGLNPGASATITQTTSRTGYASGSATISGTASVTVTSLSIGGVTAPVRGATPVTTVTAATGYTGTVTWAAGGTPLVGNFAAGTVYTATITLTATAGFTFAGVSANSFTVAGATATNLINSGVITAVFPSTIASITYSAGTGGSGTAPSSPTTVAIGGTFTTPFSLYTRAGYSFGGWSDGTNTYAASATYPASGTVTGNVVLTAQWIGVTYTVLFAYNGRTGGDSDTSKQFTTGGSAITLPTPTRTGYTFGNWFSNIALTTLVGAAGASYEPTSNLTLYAKWNPIDYTVTYNSTNVVGGSTINSSSGTAPTDSATYNIGQNVSIKSNSGSLARTGYTFAGWVTSADGTGTPLNSGQTIEMGSQSINLYPKWTANTYTFTFNLNGGSSDTTTAQATWTVGNSDITLPTTGITRTGYTFGNGNGGYWSSTQGGAAVANTYSNLGNVTLYAIWTIKTIAYSFSKGTADGLTIANFPANSSNTFGSTITLPDLAGTTVTIDSNTHLFTGWSFNNTIYRPSESFVLSEVQPTFTAIWTRLYDVRYGFAGGTKAAGDIETDSGDAECVTSGLCTPNQVITLRGAPTRTGYQFTGWKVQDSATVKAAGSTETVTATSYLFYGQWTAINYEFSFNSNGGSNSFVNQTRNIGQLLTMPDPGSRTGYTFAGWSPDNGTTRLAIDSTSVVGSASQAFVAIWTPNVYTIVYDWQGATGSVTPNASYTVGTGNLSLPVVADRVKDGFNFAGWSETADGTTPLSNYQPTTSRVLYAIWNSGNYSLTLNGNGATVATQVIQVPRTTAHILPTRTRSNFRFVGWFDADTGGNFIGNAGASYVVPASQTLFARWVQDSFYGVDEATLETGNTFIASNSTAVDSTITHNPTSSSARVQIQAGALTPGTVISVRYFKETSRQQSLIGADKNYFFSVLISWLLGTGPTATVPDTATDKPILVTLNNPAIKAGAMVYRVIGGVVSELQRATVDGSITVELRSDPELVIAAIRPTAPRSAVAASTSSDSSTISWLAPSSNGGSEVIEYTAYVATDPTKSCTTATLSCTITGLTNSTNYNFVVTATNGVGTSPASSPVSATTGTLYAVTFDSKSGSQVSSGTFFTGSTVAEPAAPSRSGFTFAGWSATDGGSAVTFPYAPGVTNDITLFARWDALSYTVTFDSKSGSQVSSGTFFTGSTVAEPAAPSRSGFTFAGWSATDGGSAVTFPYAPGAMSAITLYARWTAVTQSGGSGGGGGGSPAPSTPTPSEPVVPSTPVKSNLTVVAPIVVVGDQDAKVLTVDVLVPSAGSNAKPPVIKIDATSEKFIAQAKVVEGKLVLTPETGFSGKKTVTVTITENGADRIVQIPLTVLPETVTKPVLTPTASNRSVIRWVESPNAITYTVLLNGRRVCSTSATSCNVNRILGPDAVIEIVSNGGDSTISERVEADFRQTAPISITRIASATVTKASLTAVDTKALDKVVALIKTQGFGTVVISEITTTSKTKALAAARIESIKKYISSKVGLEEVVFEVTPVRSRTYFNNISVKG